MDDADIERTIADCARFAATAHHIGFDGVELHGAHGYLFDEFFWHLSNQRDDRYNGGPGERTRFATDTIAAMRAATSPDYPIGLRFSQWKMTRYDNKSWATPGDLEAFLTPFANAGIAFFDCSTRRYWEPEFEGSDLTLAGWTKKITGVPTMTVGSIGLDGPLMTDAEHFDTVALPTANLDRLNDMVARGEIDMICVGRAMLANADWANRVRAGELASLKPYSIEALATLA
jgi:2,4-dienoyl-CoA reductase-like NADH-dependent reductase (Old Yellow Enzyme family)